MMMVYSVRKTKVSAGEESTYGVVPGSLDIWLGLINPLEPSVKKNLIKLESLRDSIEVVGYSENYKSIEFTLNLNGFVSGRFLKYVFGSDSVSGSGPFTHNITALNSVEHPSLTIEVGQDGDVWRFVGATFGDTNIKWSKGDVVKADIRVIAKDYIKDTSLIGSATEPSDLEGKVYNWSNVCLRVDGNEVVHREGSLSIKKDMEAEPRIDCDNPNTIVRPYVGEMSYQLSFTVDKGAVPVDLLDGEHSIEIKFERSDGSYIKFIGNGVIFEQLTEPIDLGNKLVLQSYMAYIKHLEVEVVEDDDWS